MADELPETIMLTGPQGVQLVAILVALQAEDICIRGHDDEDVDAALAVLTDVGQECALQLGGLGARED